jgi:hypothetical protein
VSDHQTLITVYGEYRTSVLHTDVAMTASDDEHPTEWFVFRGDEQLATGWSRTPKKADEQAKQALDRYRSVAPDSQHVPNV